MHPVPLAELRARSSLGKRGVENERVPSRFLRLPGLRALLADDQTTRHHASVHRQLRKQATPIPTHDMWIAALVLQHDLVLSARDGHFDHLPPFRRA